LRLLLLVIGVGSLGTVGYVQFEAWLHQQREEKILDEAMKPKPEAIPTPKLRPPEGSLIGRIQIGGLDIRAIVEEGVEEDTLSRAVGHVPGTALPGETGNVGLAAHRDSFFRSLRKIRKDDRITIETRNHEYEYVVESTKVVLPTDVEVLSPTAEPALTLVTCYPFYYVGHAPKRFIVRARQVAVSSRALPNS
jgi:sortase A